MLRLAVLPIGTALALSLGGVATAFATPVDFGPVVGLPGVASTDGQDAAGRLDVRLTSGGTQLLDQQKLGLTAAGQSRGSRFGSVIVIRDLNGDGFDDALVGAPGGPGVVGRVDLLPGSKSGLTGSGAVAIASPGGTTGDGFGSAIAIGQAGDSSSPLIYLYIGAPNADVDGKSQAGAILRYSISPAGVPTYLQTITQNSPHIPGSAEAGDHFGAVLASNFRDDITVGIPDEDIGPAKDAGAVEQLTTGLNSDATVVGYEVDQNTKGVPGTAEAGDHFGAAVAGNAGAVGVPGEDIGKLKDAGEIMVQTALKGCTHLCFGRTITQNSHNIPGTAEAGDRFGAALALGIYRRTTYRCSQYNSIAIGSPGEDIGSVKDAGSVTTFMLNHEYGQDDDARGCKPLVLSQGSGLPGASEAGDQLGATLSTVPGDQFDDVDQRDAMMIGVPGEDIGSIKDAGRVLTWTSAQARSYGALGGDRAGQRFGSVLSGYQAIILNI